MQMRVWHAPIPRLTVDRTEVLLTTFSWTKVVCYDLDVVELDAGDLSAVLREVERAVGHLSADKSAAVHLVWSNVLPAIFVQTKRVACPLGGAMSATTFL